MFIQLAFIICEKHFFFLNFLWIYNSVFAVTSFVWNFKCWRFFFFPFVWVFHFCFCMHSRVSLNDFVKHILLNIFNNFWIKVIKKPIKCLPHSSSLPEEYKQNHLTWSKSLKRLSFCRCIKHGLLDWHCAWTDFPFKPILVEKKKI